MGAGNAQGIAIVMHDGTPCLRPLIDGNSPGNGSGDFRIIVVNGGGTDDKVTVAQVLCIVSDGNGDSQRTEVFHRSAVGKV